MKNEKLLKQWETIVQKQNMLSFKVTSSSRICSAHFEKTDYIIPASTSDSCRLKANVLPSVFAPHELTEEPSPRRLEMQSKRPLSSIDNTMSPPAKAAKTDSCKDDERDELERKLRKKIKS